MMLIEDCSPNCSPPPTVLASCLSLLLLAHPDLSPLRSSLSAPILLVSTTNSLAQPTPNTSLSYAGPWPDPVTQSHWLYITPSGGCCFTSRLSLHFLSLLRMEIPYCFVPNQAVIPLSLPNEFLLDIGLKHHYIR